MPCTVRCLTCDHVAMLGLRHDEKNKRVRVYVLLRNSLEAPELGFASASTEMSSALTAPTQAGQLEAKASSVIHRCPGFCGAAKLYLHYGGVLSNK